MWSYEYERTTEASPDAIWRVLADIDNWAAWDTSMESVTLTGPFAVGARVVMTPIGQESITSVITEIVDGRRYADRTEFGGVTLNFSHTLFPLSDGGSRVVHRLEISGDDAETIGPELGPAITADFPEAMDALLRAAS